MRRNAQGISSWPARQGNSGFPVSSLACFRGGGEAQLGVAIRGTAVPRYAAQLTYFPGRSACRPARFGPWWGRLGPQGHRGAWPGPGWAGAGATRSLQRAQRARHATARRRQRGEAPCGWEKGTGQGKEGGGSNSSIISTFGGQHVVNMLKRKTRALCCRGWTWTLPSRWCQKVRF